jgi:hypothetical protein
VIILKSLKFVVHSLEPTLLSRSLRIRLRHKSSIKSSLKSERRKTIPIWGSGYMSRPVGAHAQQDQVEVQRKEEAMGDVVDTQYLA